MSYYYNGLMQGEEFKRIRNDLNKKFKFVRPQFNRNEIKDWKNNCQFLTELKIVFLVLQLKWFFMQLYYNYIFFIAVPYGEAVIKLL